MASALATARLVDTALPGLPGALAAAVGGLLVLAVAALATGVVPARAAVGLARERAPSR